MVAIPFPISSAPGFRAQESAGRLINCFAEALGENRSDPAKRIRVPGLTKFLTSSQTGFRGMMELSSGSTLYVAFNGQLYKGTSAGGPLTAHNVLAGTKSVYFARNNKASPDKVVVTENGAFIIVDPSTISAYPDPDLPPNPNSVFGIDGYLVFTIADQRVFASDLNATSLNPLSFGTTYSKPDPLVRGIPFSGRALFFGSQTLEIWINVGATPFPFQRSVVIPFGLLAPDAVAGWEDGWGAGLLWVANDYTVRRLDGYTPVKASPPDLERLLSRDPNPQNLLANVFMVDGHPMWTITGTTYSWVFDLVTQKWHERASYLRQIWRGKQTWLAFGKWLIGDALSGNIHIIDPTNHTEDGQPLSMRIESAPVEKFPQRVRVARADFHVDTGVGFITGIDPTQTDPEVEISWSDDGGINWGPPMIRKIGRQSVDRNVSVFRTGMTTRHGRRWRLDVHDPLYVAIFGGDQSAELRGP